MSGEESVETPSTEEISSIAALHEPVRRALYRYVVEQGGEVTRDQAAAATGISRALAVFHLDRLVDERLLEVSFRRLGEKRGPGAGRPSKLYRRSTRQVDVSLPPRSYELAAQLLASALEQAPSPAALEALSEAARGFGRNLGGAARSVAGSEMQGDELLDGVQAVLASYGFEPVRAPDGAVRLRNCPFHALVERHRGLVCGMNLSLMSGVVEGLEVEGIRAVLDPQPGMCCVCFQSGSDLG